MVGSCPQNKQLKPGPKSKQKIELEAEVKSKLKNKNKILIWYLTSVEQVSAWIASRCLSRILK
jgi:hypothetical protein